MSVWDTMEPDFIPNQNNNVTSVDDLLGQTLAAAPESNYELGVSAAAGVSKVDYNKLYAFQNVISHSMEEVLNSCPRKFQFFKLQAGSKEGRTRHNNVTFAFGHAVGAGVAVYDQSRDLRAAIWAAFLAWDIDLFAVETPKENRPDPRKSFPDVVYALEKYAVFHEENGFDEYEVLEVEATVCVDLETSGPDAYDAKGNYIVDPGPEYPTQFHTGHIDELLRHRVTGALRVKENKTTAFSSINPALYSNSNQTIGYSVVVAMYGALEYDVLYTVYSSSEQRWISFDFQKTNLAYAEWLKTELVQAEIIRIYADDNFFPKRGGSCFAYSRECELYGQCDLGMEKHFGQKFSELPVATMESLNAIEHFKYVTTRSQIVAQIKENMK